MAARAVMARRSSRLTTASTVASRCGIAWRRRSISGRSAMLMKRRLELPVDLTVVLGVNNRVPSGYGKTFITSDDGKHGREPLWDCVAAKKYLGSLGYVDETKIGIAGGSYGGYMVLAARAFKPEGFAVGVDLFGVSNWVRTLQSIPPYWESFRKSLYKEIGDPSKDLDNL